MNDLTLDDVQVGDTVNAFHPRTLGVIYQGEVTRVGRRYVHVRFGVDQRSYRMLPQYVTGVTGRA